MNRKATREGIGPGAVKLLAIVLTVLLTGFASLAEAVYSLPANRSVRWRGNVGVEGDIPLRAVICKSLGPSGRDDAPAIQTAIGGCPPGQVVKLDSGTFSIGSPITVKSGVTLRGAGMGATVIKGVHGMSGAFVIGFKAGSYQGASLSLAAGMSKGSSTITTGIAHHWREGDLVLIDQLNDAAGDPVVTNVGTDGACTWCGRSGGTRSLGQIAKVIAVPTSNTATLEMPLYWNYARALNPQATRMGGLTANAGIEDLTVDNSLSGGPGQSSDGATIAFYGSANCWLLRVEAIGSFTNMVRMKGCYRNTIRSCALHEGIPALPATGRQYSTGRAYGIVMDFSSANLIEDNQIYHLTMGTAMRGPTSGNVVAYNFITDMYFSDSAAWQTDSFDFHGGHAMMNLFEGNYVAKGRMCADVVWGSSSHNSFFRNRNTIDASRPLAAWDYSLYKYSTYYNLVGNVIGSRGFETDYILQTNSTDKTAIFGFDALPLATVLVHANWDAVNNKVSWNGSDDRSLPASLYLSGKPDWWGSGAWPAIGPDLSPMYPAAPPVGGGTPWGASKPRLSPPASLSAK